MLRCGYLFADRLLLGDDHAIGFDRDVLAAHFSERRNHDLAFEWDLNRFVSAVEREHEPRTVRSLTFDPQHATVVFAGFGHAERFK